MKLLITGGLGFVGGRLAQHAAVKSAASDITLGTRGKVQSVEWLPQARVVRMNWDSVTALEESCSGVDCVVHAAGMNAADSAADPVAALEVNGVMTDRLVNAAARRGARRFVYVSTAHVYGSPLQGDITEETCPTPVHPYATSHRAGEDAVRAANADGSLDAIVVRLSNSFGRPVDKDVNCWTLLVNDLCRQAVTARRLTLTSSGLQRRDFVPLSEVCRAIEHLIRVPREQLGAAVFTGGAARALTLLEMAGLIADRCESVLGFRPPIEHAVPQRGEQSLDLTFQTHALSRTGFEPRPDTTSEIDGLLEFCSVAFN
jgi:UDP-glucose 4-epimerase